VFLAAIVVPMVFPPPAGGTFYDEDLNVPDIATVVYIGEGSELGAADSRCARAVYRSARLPNRSEVDLAGRKMRCFSSGQGRAGFRLGGSRLAVLQLPL
jgi:hypothetical protein